MKFSLEWLKRHIDTDASIHEICNKLNEIGLEVEECHNQIAQYNGLIIAKILSAEQHPNADNLRVCKVSAGGDAIFNVVCGAANARAGINVVLATIGTIIPNGSFEIKKSKIRGVESEGMMCSADELCLSHDMRFANDGIIELHDGIKIGQSFAEYAELNDVLFEIALTPNRRRDCASVYGIARELAAAGIGTLKGDLTTPPSFSQEMPQIKVQIIANDSCSQFNHFIATNTIIRNDTEIMSKVRDMSDNALVNISNFTMFNFGNPNHMYDLHKITGDTIYVKMSEGGEEFIAIGGKSYILPKNILIICDAEKVLCIAGVMGSELSKVTESTTHVLVETANFSQKAIAFASQTLNIISDSKYRFEGGIDWNSVDKASEILASYFEKPSIISKTYGAALSFLTHLTISIHQIEKYLGMKVQHEEIFELLSRLSFNPVIQSQNEFHLTIPTWKQGNVETYREIIEDLLRVGLMEQINSTQNHRRFIRTTDIHQNMLQTINDYSHDSMMSSRVMLHSIQSEMRNNLMARGINEVVTWSFYSHEDEFMMEGNHTLKYCINKDVEAPDRIELVNPLNSNFKFMRRSIIPNLVHTLLQHPNNLEESFSIFEIGNIYSRALNNFEAMSVCGLRAGNVFENSLHNKMRQWSFFDVREDFLSLLRVFNMNDKITDYTFDDKVPAYYHPHKSIRIKLGNIVLGICGELHPMLVKTLNISHSSVAIFELFTHNIPSKCYKVMPSKSLTLFNYQRIERDLAFIVNQDLYVGDIVKTIYSCKEKYIESVKVFDVYSGIEENKKSVALSICIQPQFNMTDEMIQNIMNNIIQAVIKKYDARLRDK